MKLLGPTTLQAWISALTQHTGRPEAVLLAEGLQALDFPNSGLVLEADDGSVAHFKHAFAIKAASPSTQVAVFTEHNGHFLVELSEHDTLQDLSHREVLRWPGKHHCIPFLPCPLCGSEVDVLELTDTQSYDVDCPGCGLRFGGPDGYGSCLYMAYDWNRRTTETPPESPPSDN